MSIVGGDLDGDDITLGLSTTVGGRGLARNQRPVALPGVAQAHLVAVGVGARRGGFDRVAHLRAARAQADTRRGSTVGEMDGDGRSVAAGRAIVRRELEAVVA